MSDNDKERGEIGIPFKKSASINHYIEILPEDNQSGQDANIQSSDDSGNGGSSQNSKTDADDNS